MIIDDQEFEGIFWDIHKIGNDVDLRKKYGYEFKEVFPSLNRTERAETNRIVRYIIYMYDKESPVRHRIKKIEERKTYSAKKAGYSNKVDEVKRKRIIDSRDPLIVHAICEFIEYINDFQWAQLVTDEQLFWDYNKQLMEAPQKGKKIPSTEITRKKALRAEVKALQEDIENLEYTIFAGDRELAETVKEVRKSATFPEQIAL